MQRAGSATRAYVAAAVAAGLVVVMLFLHSHATSDLGRAERSSRQFEKLYGQALEEAKGWQEKHAEAARKLGELEGAGAAAKEALESLREEAAGCAVKLGAATEKASEAEKALAESRATVEELELARESHVQVGREMALKLQAARIQRERTERQVMELEQTVAILEEQKADLQDWKDKVEDKLRRLGVKPHPRRPPKRTGNETGTNETSTSEQEGPPAGTREGR